MFSRGRNVGWRGMTTVVFCATGEIEEIVFHLFIQCPFSTRCWRTLGITWDTNLDFFPMPIAAKEQFGRQYFVKNSPWRLG
jgi:hypothetical protein